MRTHLEAFLHDVAERTDGPGASRPYRRIMRWPPRTVRAILDSTVAPATRVPVAPANAPVSPGQRGQRPTNPLSSEASAHLQGFFFNAGVPIPGDHIHDVSAEISIGRRSDSLDPPRVLRIRAQVHVHNGPELFAQDIGTVRLGQRVRLRIQWDPDNDRFIFQRDEEPEILAPYAVTDTAPPGIDSKFVDVVNLAANCTTSPLPVASMEALFDDVFVNASAAP